MLSECQKRGLPIASPKSKWGRHRCQPHARHSRRPCPAVRRPLRNPSGALPREGTVRSGGSWQHGRCDALRTLRCSHTGVFLHRDARRIGPAGLPVLPQTGEWRVWHRHLVPAAVRKRTGVWRRRQSWRRSRQAEAGICVGCPKANLADRRPAAWRFRDRPDEQSLRLSFPAPEGPGECPSLSFAPNDRPLTCHSLHLRFAAFVPGGTPLACFPILLRAQPTDRDSSSFLSDFRGFPRLSRGRSALSMDQSCAPEPSRTSQIRDTYPQARHAAVDK